MRQQLLFHFVFLSQVLLISFYLPRLVLSRVRHMIDRYPRSEYPRLYPQPARVVDRAERTYRTSNLLVLLVGIAVLLRGVLWPGSEPFAANDLVQVGYLVLQFAALGIVPMLSFPYFSLHRTADSPATRTAALRPRRLFDFVSPTLFGTAVFAYLAFIVLILYVRQFDFPWFGGYLNIAIMTAMNVFFAVQAYSLLYGRKKDPFALHADRLRGIERAIRLLLFVSIGATLFVALNIALHALDMHELNPIATSLYIQILAMSSLREFRVEGVNFEVYREEPVAT